MVFVETRSAVAASATVSKVPKDDGPMQTALQSVEADGLGDIGAVSLS
jgi:hypothetical protein